MPDVRQQLGSSLIQHGKSSDRIYVMELADEDMPSLIEDLEKLARARRYSKIFAKVPGRWRHLFRQAGYRSEAVIPHFFAGREEGHFMGRFLDPRRSLTRSTATLQQIIHLSLKKAELEMDKARLPPGLDLRQCLVEDVESMSNLYRLVFASYPFPITEPGFLLETMTNNVVYFGAWVDGQLVGLASAEQYLQARNAEMTDFATHPDFRGQGLAQALLRSVEDYARSVGHRTAFTIARARSAGMNITFARRGYSFAGTLINNTQISGNIESMNVWYKSLPSRKAAPRRVSRASLTVENERVTQNAPLKSS
jgi:beta-lysine N6-acetyltransferase